MLTLHKTFCFQHRCQSLLICFSGLVLLIAREFLDQLESSMPISLLNKPKFIVLLDQHWLVVLRSSFDYVLKQPINQTIYLIKQTNFKVDIFAVFGLK